MEPDDGCSERNGAPPYASDVTQATHTESSCILLDLLPSEIVRSILSRYCDGRSLSTFLLAISSSAKCRRQGIMAVAGALTVRFGHLGQRISVEPHLLFSVQDETNELKSFRNMESARELATKMGKWSRGLAVLSFFEQHEASTPHLDQNSEWPIWCGILRLQFTEHDSPRGARIEEARVVVTTTHWKSAFVRNWHSYMEHRSALFSPEPRRFVPLAPFGRIRGLTREDCITLSLIVRRLEECNEVALPPASLSTRSSSGVASLNEIRIISRRQAHQRLVGAGLQRRAENLWHVDNEVQDDLLAFWNDDHDELDGSISIENVVDDMIHLMGTKSHLHRSNS